MSPFLLSQLLIGVAFFVDLASFQFRQREYTVLCFSFAAALVSAHFFLLGATTGGTVVAVSAFRHLTGVFTIHATVKYFWLACIVALGLYTFDGKEDMFAILAGIFGTMAVFQPDERKLRIIGGVGTTSLIVHNVLIWTPAGIALEVAFLASNVVSYWRFYVRTAS